MDPLATIETSHHGACPWVKISGRATMPLAPSFLQCLNQLSQGQPPGIWVDLSCCEHLDSTFAGSLIGFSQKGRAGSRPPLHLNAPSPACRELFERMHLDSHLLLEDAPAPAAWQAYAISDGARCEMAEVVIQAHQNLADSDPRNQEFGRIAEAFRRSHSQNS